MNWELNQFTQAICIKIQFNLSKNIKSNNEMSSWKKDKKRRRSRVAAVIKGNKRGCGGQVAGRVAHVRLAGPVHVAGMKSCYWEERWGKATHSVANAANPQGQDQSAKINQRTWPKICLPTDNGNLRAHPEGILSGCYGRLQECLQKRQFGAHLRLVQCFHTRRNFDIPVPRIY